MSLSNCRLSSANFSAGSVMVIQMPCSCPSLRAMTSPHTNKASTHQKPQSKALCPRAFNKKPRVAYNTMRVIIYARFIHVVLAIAVQLRGNALRRSASLSTIRRLNSRSLSWLVSTNSTNSSCTHCSNS